MIEELFGDVNGRTEGGEVRGERPSEVVKRPRPNRARLVEGGLAL